MATGKNDFSKRPNYKHEFTLCTHSAYLWIIVDYSKGEAWDLCHADAAYIGPF